MPPADAPAHPPAAAEARAVVQVRGRTDHEDEVLCCLLERLASCCGVQLGVAPYDGAADPRDVRLQLVGGALEVRRVVAAYGAVREASRHYPWGTAVLPRLRVTMQRAPHAT